MALRDRVKRVFRRSSLTTAPKTNRNGIKIEYYRRNEVPKSKFKGPFDPEHQKQLAAWSFQTATAERPRSQDISLSPCTSLPDYIRPPQQNRPQEDEEIAPDQVTEEPAPDVDVMDTSPTVTQVEDTQRQADGGSQSSTMVDPDSYSGSMMTLLPENHRDGSICNIKETIRYTSPVLRTASPPPMSPKGAAYMPFSPDDLTRALNAVQIY
ncbi:uncharacterized protein EURHEDRAFT_410166 [Aspergillus ruber CBS 135680]|uniref:Uncharacterized protein n=1 Tax=Aspergillus ruber (strain CBS 135680) TaxID=1388766 RepID=A0A017SJN7_ASPRC|nr:uncharacterized protein EURHEDRAFT_410166 [Aspergillus ruber CBS 135680]EYE97127.1 hypothetical protein EURHEDRAFT_410166 [Aspergillus ruber CBS 135680]